MPTSPVGLNRQLGQPNRRPVRPAIRSCRRPAIRAVAEDPPPSNLEDVLDDLLESAQRLAIDVIGCSPDMRDEVMVRMGILLTEVAKETGCTRELALEFGSAMEQVVRDYVAEIEASGGGTVGTA